MSVRHPSATGFTLMELLVAVAVIMLLLAMMLQVVQMVRGSARTVVCLNNLRQLGFASLGWSHDHRGVVVPSWDDALGAGTIASKWQGQLRPYLFNDGPVTGARLEATFRCPESRGAMTWQDDDPTTYGKNIWTGQCPPPGNDNGYHLVPYARIANPAEALFLADTAAYPGGTHPRDLHPWIATGVWGVAFAHRGRGAFLLLDGHCETRLEAVTREWTEDGCTAFWSSHFWNVLGN